MRTLQEVLKGESEVSFTIKCMTDFKFFVERVIGDEFPDFVSGYIRKIIDPKNKTIVIQLPRGHSKTTTISINFSIWHLWKEQKFKIAITSSTMTQSMRILEEIQLKLEDNEFLVGLVPPSKSTSWNKTEMITTNGCICFAKQFNDTARGEHVDLLICDDVLRAEGITHTQIKEIFWGIFYPYVQTRGGRIIVVGTPLQTDDLLAELSKKFPVSIKLQAIITNDKGEWIRPLWETRFSLEKFKDIMENQGGLIFAREYMCNPLAAGSKIFAGWLVQRQLKSVEINEPRKNENYFLAIDIALSAEKSADFTVFCVIGKDDNGILWVRKVERYKGLPTDDIINKTRELNKKFRFHKIYPEATGLGKGIALDMKNVATNPSIAPIVEPFDTNRKNKELIIGHLQGQLMAGNLFLANNEQMIYELQTFDKMVDERTGKETYESVGEHDDTVMALAIAVYGATQLTGDYAVEFV